MECAGCGTAWHNPRPSVAQLGDYYANAESYGFWAREIFPATAERRREAIARPQAQRLVEAVDRAGCGRGLLVEIGAGSGLVLEGSVRCNDSSGCWRSSPRPAWRPRCAARISR